MTLALSRSPNERLGREVLPELLSGRSWGAFLLTEPGVGSDAAAITCAIQKVENGYRIAGAKSWVTNGVNADVLLTFGQSNPGAGAKGMLAVVARRNQPGVKASDALNLFGSHAMGTSDVAFDDCLVGDEAVAFPAGGGFQAAMGGLNVARLGVAALCNGALQGGLECAVRYATARQAFGKPIYAFQGVQMPLANVATSLEASRSLTFQAIALLDAGQDCTVLAAHAKKYATQTAFQGLSVCMQALGANGLKDEFGLGRQLAAARVAEFMDGTGEIQNIVIGRALAKNLAGA
ncbi:MAG: acyl-CoA dehydrogenase family protein [Rhizobiales bacterium]|nr:acyl-CoA dehydrogenase family protein [Hyphomicrobiales bacterium]